MVYIMGSDGMPMTSPWLICLCQHGQSYGELYHVWLHQLAKSPNSPQGGVGHSQGSRHLYAFLANRLVAYLAVIIASQKYTTLSSYVCLTVDSVLGDTLYSTVYNETFLYKINITKQKVTYQCNMAGDNPNCCGLYSMTFLLKEHPLICPL
jgi:hypothetical protein